MKLPKEFIDVISNTFYDKTVEILKNVITVDEEGGVTKKGIEVVDTFKGNVSFSNCKEIQKDYGLDYEINIAITTYIDNKIKISDLVKYNNIIFEVTDVLPFDSHLLIVGVKWE